MAQIPPNEPLKKNGLGFAETKLRENDSAKPRLILLGLTHLQDRIDFGG